MHRGVVFQQPVRQLPNGRTYKFACAIFENKHLEGSELRTPTLKARLIFRHADGRLILDLEHAAWWPKERSYVIFSANSPKQLLLFFSASPDADEANLWARSIDPQPAVIGGMARRGIHEGESHPITERIGIIEIELLTENERVYSKVLKFDDDGEIFPTFIGTQE